MKVTANQVARLLQAPTAWVAVLLHGDDTGLVRERAARAVHGVLGPVRDPFRHVVLSREEHGRLAEEVQSRPLGGGRKVIVVPEATDALAGALERLGAASADVLLVLQAGALGAKSKLRLVAEKRPDVAAIACFPERAPAVAAEITQMLASAGLGIAADALAFLSGELAGDTVRRRAEVTKLALYAHGEAVVTLEMGEACCAVEADTTIGAVVAAALGGRRDQCDQLLDELSYDSVSGVGLLVVLGMQVQKLLRVRALMGDGLSVTAAISSLQPPVYASQVASFEADLRRWPTGALMELGRAIHEADLACKRARSADLAIAGQLLTAVARRAASLASA